VKLADLMRRLAKYLCNRTGVKRQTIGGDCLNAQASVVEGGFEAAKECKYATP